MSRLLIQGSCDDRFLSVRDIFEKNFEEGHEIGGAFSLAIDGKPVVDLWGGHVDLDRSREWQSETIVPVTSCSKIPLYIAAMILIDRGLIDLNAAIAHYWPVFGQAGKENILVRHIFSHSTGVAGFDCETTPSFFDDPERVRQQLERQEPWWEPGTASGYHNMTSGNLLGELIERVSGMTYPEFVKEEILSPLSANYWASMQKDVDPGALDIAEIEYATPGGNNPTPDPNDIGYRARKPMLNHFPDWVADPKWFCGRFHALDGYTNARHLSRIGSILSCDGLVGEHQFLTKEMAQKASVETMYTEDKVFHLPIRFGLGVGLASKEFPIPFEKAMHWGGYGGSMIFMIPEARACYAYTPNRYINHQDHDPRGSRLAAAANQCLLEL